MGRFANMSSNVYYAVGKILDNQDLLKLIYYDSYNPLSEPDIVEPKKILIPEYVYPGFKIPDIDDKQQVILTVECDSAKLSGNPKFTNSKLVFNIMCHTKLWMIDGEIRPYLICEEIDKIFGEKRNTNLTMGSIPLDRCQKVIYNNKFAGYVLMYNLCDSN